MFGKVGGLPHGKAAVSLPSTNLTAVDDGLLNEALYLINILKFILIDKPYKFAHLWTIISHLNVCGVADLKRGEAWHIQDS